MRIGDLVNSYQKNRLFCGSGTYPYAVVMSIKPFILVSLETDMRWDSVQPNEVGAYFGRASLVSILKCMRRLTQKEKFRTIKQLAVSINDRY